jgi:DNA adenine methylase
VGIRSAGDVARHRYNVALIMGRPVLAPFLKWAGGKRWFVHARPDLLRFQEERYIEPFVGSGAVYFHLQPFRAQLSDANRDLIATYQAIKSDWRRVHSELRNYADRHSAENYYLARGVRSGDIYSEAARFIYLNRTCWNGLYRVNRKGEFNVPIGTKTNVLLPSDDFERIAGLLDSADLYHRDFEVAIDDAAEDDFLFVDPPYTVKHNLNGFLKYNENIFSWDDQVRLRDALIRADARGARILMTNADHESIRELYDGVFWLEPIARNSVLAGAGGTRGQVTELLIRNW